MLESGNYNQLSQDNLVTSILEILDSTDKKTVLRQLRLLDMQLEKIDTVEAMPHNSINLSTVHPLLNVLRRIIGADDVADETWSELRVIFNRLQELQSDATVDVTTELGNLTLYLKGREYVNLARISSDGLIKERIRNTHTLITLAIMNIADLGTEYEDDIDPLPLCDYNENLRRTYLKPSQELSDPFSVAECVQIAEAKGALETYQALFAEVKAYYEEAMTPETSEERRTELVALIKDRGTKLKVYC
jgi:hypothetical protein